MVATSEEVTEDPRQVWLLGEPWVWSASTGRSRLSSIVARTGSPERHGATLVYKAVARNDLGGDRARLDAFIAEEDQILVEDLRILEAYDHETLPLDRTVEVRTAPTGSARPGGP